MKISLRGWLVLGTFVALTAALVAMNSSASNAQQASQVRPGQLSETSLGNLLRAMGLKPEKQEKRYDFTFSATYKGEEWDLTMSAVLSENGRWIWVMGWLDELPRSAADVPRTALLRLLANNDRLGNGKFFAYIASNRRFVLQRVIPNENMSTAEFRRVLQDLGTSVVETYPHWSVANWKTSTTPSQTSRTANSRGSKTAPSKSSRGTRSPIRR